MKYLCRLSILACAFLPLAVSGASAQDSSKYLARTLEGHGDAVRALAFSKDGLLVSGSNDGTLRLWDAKTGAAVRTIPLPKYKAYPMTDMLYPAQVGAVAISADGSRIASASVDKVVRIWNAGDGKLLHTLSDTPDTVGTLAFSQDGAQLLSGDQGGSIKLWNARDGQLIKSVTLPMRKAVGTSNAFKQSVTAVSFTPDQKRALTISTDSTIRLWDLPALTTSFSANHSRGLTSVAMSSDGAKAVSGWWDDPNANTLKVTDMATGKETRAMKGPIHAVFFLPDNSRFVAAGCLRTPEDISKFVPCKEGDVKVMDSATGAEIAGIKVPGGHVSAAALSTDGTLLATGTDKAVRLWNTAEWAKPGR